MAILIMCSNPMCGELLDVPEDAVGKKARCPSCGTVQVIGGATGIKGAMLPSSEACPSPIESPEHASGDGSKAPKPTVEGPGHARADLGMAPKTGIAPVPVPAEPKTAPKKPAPKEAADGDIIDLTQFNEWVPGAQAGAGPASGRGSRPAPTPAGPKKPLEKRPWEMAADQGVVDLTVLRQLQMGDAPARPRGKLPVQPPATPAEPPAPTDPQGTPADSAIAYAETCRDAIKRRRQASQDGNMAATLLDDLAHDSAPECEPLGEGALESRTAVCVIFAMGVLGILGGAAGGYFIFGGHPIAGVYIGGALGWMAGFVVACLFILSVEHDDNRSRCPSCGYAFADGAEVCPGCGLVLTVPAVNPITRGGLHAGSYALDGKRAVAGMALLAFIVGGIAQAVYQAAIQRSYLNGWGWGLIAFVGLILVYLGGYLLEFLIVAVIKTLRLDDRPPSLPSLLSGRIPRAAVGAMGIACAYVVPLVTLPLLPLGLLHLSAASMGKAMNPKLAVTAALRRSGDFAVLWLMTFLWSAGLLLSLTLAVVAFLGMDRVPAWLGTADTPWVNAIRAGMWILITALKFAVVSTVVSVFGLAIARCIGLFGRRCGLLRTAPAESGLAGVRDLLDSPSPASPRVDDGVNVSVQGNRTK